MWELIARLYVVTSRPPEIRCHGRENLKPHFERSVCNSAVQ